MLTKPTRMLQQQQQQQHSKLRLFTITKARLSSGLGLAALLAIAINGAVLFLFTDATTRNSSSGAATIAALEGSLSVPCHLPTATTGASVAKKEEGEKRTPPSPQEEQQRHLLQPPETNTSVHIINKSNATSVPINTNDDDASSNSSSNGTLLLKSVLLPPPVEYLRRGVALGTVYDFPERKDKYKNKWCSCLNPHINSTNCCQRLFRRAHKMGYMLTLNVLDDFPQVKLYGIEPLAHDYLNKRKPPGDFRDVLLWRDIYSSIVSGYLYHKDGRECYKDPWGNPSKEHHFHLVRTWKRRISYDIPEKQRKMMFCIYLQRESEEKGLQAYIEWVFLAHYRVMLSSWALSVGFPHVSERTLNICYEDLSSKDSQRAETTMTNVLNFFFNGTKHKRWKGYEPGQNDAGGHATPHDPDLRKRLIKTIKKIDHKYYNGDISWLDSMLPC